MLGVKWNFKILYSFFGILFGLLFPVFSTIFEIFIHDLDFNFSVILYIQKTNKLLWVINTAPFFLGLFAYFIGFNQDKLVGKQKKTVGEFLNLELKFSTLFKDAEFGILIFHLASGKFENINPFFYNLLGYNKEELEEIGFDKITHPEDLIEERKVFKKILRTKESASFQKRFINKEKQIIWCKMTYSVIRDESGKAVSIFTLIDDITKEKVSSEELLAQQKFIREVINLSPDLIFVKDNIGKFILVNEAFARSYNKQIYEIENNLNTEIHNNKEELKSYDVIDKLVLEKNMIISTEEDFSSMTGEKLRFSTTKIPITNSNSQKFILGFSRDITNIKNTEANLIKAKESAEQTSRMKSDFLANMSHEIRTPLNGILGMSRILFDTKLDEDQKDIVETIKNSGDSLLVILNDILDYSKIEAGKIELEKISFDLLKFGKEIYSLFNYTAKNKKLDFKLEIDSKIKKNLVGDQFRLRQVILNLIGNAIKFTESGVVELKISLVEEFETEYKILFEVKDSGIGIPKDKLLNLFQSFTQIDSSISRKYGGTGLGLAISSKLISLMNSELKVESEFGIGARFYFELIFETIKKEEVVLVSKLVKTIPLHIKILLAEDNIINQKLALKIFKKIGYEITIANNGEEAFQLLNKNKFDIIFMDMQMPVLDGIKATKKIREDSIQKDIPIVALTANAMSTDKELCFQAGMNGYISKPFKQEDIEIIITEFFQET